MAQSNPILQGGTAYGNPVAITSPVANVGQSPQLSTPGALGIPSVDTESQKATYIFTTASMALVATPTDFFQLAGAASVAIRIKRIWAQVTSTVSGQLSFQIAKRSTGSTGGTSASGTVSKCDSASATNSGLVTCFTANPSTTGTTISSMWNWSQPVNAAATPQQPVIPIFGNANDQSFVLRSATEFLVLNGSLSTLTNADNKITLNVEWTEESTAV